MRKTSFAVLAACAALVCAAGDASAQRGRKVAAKGSAAKQDTKAQKPAAATAKPANNKEDAKPAAEKPAAEAEAPAPPSALRGPMRIDFDDRLVQGQTNKLGAVYLYQRKDPQQGSLLERKKSFRDEIGKDLVE
jgi:hypothetical protein